MSHRHRLRRVRRRRCCRVSRRRNFRAGRRWLEAHWPSARCAERGWAVRRDNRRPDRLDMDRAMRLDIRHERRSDIRRAAGRWAYSC